MVGSYCGADVSDDASRYDRPVSYLVDEKTGNKLNGQGRFADTTGAQYRDSKVGHVLLLGEDKSIQKPFWLLGDGRMQLDLLYGRKFFEQKHVPERLSVPAILLAASKFSKFSLRRHRQ